METLTETTSTPRQETTASLGQAVLVLGMHRSGTSAISRVLNLMGVDLGKDLMPAAPDNNETGFWEHRILQWINRRTFESLGREWDSVLSLPERWWEQPQIEDLRKELQQSLEAEFAKSPLWGSKDPRLCFLLPMWRALLGKMNYEPRCVLIFRNPIEVARSLEKRDRLPASQSYLMWLRSLVEAERGSRGLARTLSTYESLLGNWKHQVQRIGNHLKIDWPVSMDEAAPAVDEFLRPSLRHHQVDNECSLNDSSIPELVRRAFAVVLAAAESGNVDQLSSAVDEIAGELDDNQPMVMRFVADLEQKQHRVAAQSKETGEQLTVVRKELAAAQAELATTRNALAAEQLALAASQQAATDLQLQQAELEAAMTVLRDQLGAKISERDNTINQLNGTITQLNIDVTALNAAVDQLNYEIAQLRAGIAHLEREVVERDSTIHLQNLSISEKTSVLALRQLELAGYQEQRQILRDVTQKVWNSRSWRWTAPFRSLQKVPLTLHQLVASSPMAALGPHRWQSEGAAHFILPCLPVCGHIRIRLKMTASVPAEAMLYFDTGRFFNDDQRLHLGTVKGELVVEQFHLLKEPVYCFRFDPVQLAAEFDIERLEILPVRSFTRKSKA